MKEVAAGFQIRLQVLASHPIAPVGKEIPDTEELCDELNFVFLVTGHFLDYFFNQPILIIEILRIPICGLVNIGI